MDVQGPEKPKFYLQKAETTLTTLVDEKNVMGQLYGFKAIPNVYLINSDGKVEYIELGTFNIKEPNKRTLLQNWSSGKEFRSLQVESFEQSIHEKANSLFVVGQQLLNDGKPQEAVEIWRKAISIDPNNYIIRKQIWAIENPDRFYKDKVDYPWQDAQLEKGL
ncbi:MAG: hypothetical protein DK302_000023 [Chloroflexi bacterium]|nr:MAG: hypothetical protein DK302_000023 [Chloroflexota bacterium]|tara:strand:+ start:912 stop:1400 length:489 start_codon:yes stop_codon:yes gene_type:complete